MDKEILLQILFNVDEYEYLFLWLLLLFHLLIIMNNTHTNRQILHTLRLNGNIIWLEHMMHALCGIIDIRSTLLTANANVFFSCSLQSVSNEHAACILWHTQMAVMKWKDLDVCLSICLRSPFLRSHCNFYDCRIDRQKSYAKKHRILMLAWNMHDKKEHQIRQMKWIWVFCCSLTTVLSIHFRL